jgi:tetratricopeptide (TPR) repeat protein
MDVALDNEGPGVLTGLDAAGALILRAYTGDGEGVRALARRRLRAAGPALPLRRALSLLVSIARAARLGPGGVLRMLRETRAPALRRPDKGEACSVGAGQFLLTAAAALAVAGETREAARLYIPALALREISRSLFLMGGERMVETILGMTAAAAGEWSKAEDHYQTAIRQAEELPHRIEQPEARLWYGKMLLSRGAAGDREKAAGLVREALAMYRTLGMPRHVEMAERVLLEAGKA